ncbi:MAG: ribonuclease III domain-containing protein [Pseudomonadota bacterium]
MTYTDAPHVDWPTTKKERDALWAELEERIGYHFRNAYLRDWAMINKAWAGEVRAKTGTLYQHNQRLEWLGDSLINVFATTRILREDHAATTGDGTERRKGMVSNDVLGDAGYRIGLAPLLLLGRGDQKTGWKTGWRTFLANAVEALVAAVWLDVAKADAGLDRVKITEAVYDAIVPPESGKDDPSNAS